LLSSFNSPPFVSKIDRWFLDVTISMPACGGDNRPFLVRQISLLRNIVLFSEGTARKSRTGAGPAGAAGLPLLIIPPADKVRTTMKRISHAKARRKAE
jgi:hypothetical protein